MKESECHQLWMSAISCLLRLFHGIFILASKLWHRSLFTSQIEWNKKLSVSASQNPLVLPVPPCQAHLGILFIFFFPFYWLKITGGFILQHEVSWPNVQRGFLPSLAEEPPRNLLWHRFLLISITHQYQMANFGGFHVDFRPAISHQLCGW